MKKLSLAVACSSLILSPLALADTNTEVPQEPAGTTYFTGNAQYHTDGANNVTSTLEMGHTFTSGTTILAEIDGIQLGTYQDGATPAAAALTLGLEQSYSFNDNLWVAAGYHHLTIDGKAFQYRPLVKIGYNFDNGISISNRTRFHIDAIDNNDDTRMDNAIAYALPSTPVALKYNNVYMIDAESMDHEFRATWTRSGLQPYAEIRSQGNNTDNTNTAFVVGASYAF